MMLSLRYYKTADTFLKTLFPIGGIKVVQAIVMVIDVVMIGHYVVVERMSYTLQNHRIFDKVAT